MDHLWRLVTFTMTIAINLLLGHILNGLEAVEVREVVGPRVQANIETVIKLADYLVSTFIILVVEQVLAVHVASAQ